MDTGMENAGAELAHLQKEERSLSTRRTRLQNRLDFLRAGGGAPDQVAELERQEREISEQRRELHERIELAAAAVRRQAASRQG